MMRACSCAIKARQRRNRDQVETIASDSVLASVLDGSETLTTNDGMFILKEMQGPLPSTIVDQSSYWWPFVERWITSVIGLEKHHGSRGHSVLAAETPEAVDKMDPQKKAPVSEMTKAPAVLNARSAPQELVRVLADRAVGQRGIGLAQLG